MNPTNITRAEAQDRSRHLRAETYDILVDLSGRLPDGGALSRPEENFCSRSTVTFTVLEASHDHTINLIADELLDAELDGKPLAADALVDNRLHFAAEAGPHTLVVTALCRYSRTGEGLHRFIDPADGRTYLYSQFESADARRVFACFEQPDQKATFTFHVVAPRGWEVISNAPAETTADVDDGFARWDFATTQRMAPYVTAIVAGEYDRVETSYEGKAGTVPMALLTRRSLSQHLDADKVFETTKRGFEVFEEAFGTPYAFGKYDQAFVPEFNAGAMENAGCVTHRDEYVFRSRVPQAAIEGRDNTILHELCHMWFGDLVTMRWWDDLWLNESFAEWGSHFAQAKIAERYDTGVDPWAGFCNSRKAWAYAVDQMPTTHPIAADMVDLEAVELNFDGITYAKGAATLRQLVAFVGEDEFLDGIRGYFRAHAFGNTELSDLLGALQEASGRDLSWFSGEWLETTGVNTLRPSFLVGEDGTYERFSIEQYATDDHPTLRTHRLAVGLYDLDGDVLRRVARTELDVSGASTPVPDLIGATAAPLILVNDDDLTFAKVRLDERSLATLIEHMHQLDSRLARAVCWSAVWDMVRDGELKTRDYFALVLRGIASETDPDALGAALGLPPRTPGRLATAIDEFTPPQHRAETRAALVRGLASLLRDAEPGSDHQLAYVKALATVADSDQAAQLIRGWLDGEEVPTGLTLDTDLRWNLLLGLARRGHADDALVDATLAADPTITGREWAAAVRAARPDAASKAEAWRIAVEDPSTPNETQRQVCWQFWQADQDEVLAPYVERYFAVVREISDGTGRWREASSAITNVIVVRLFPTTLRTPEMLQRLDAFMGEGDLSDSVRRQLTEQRDALERAIRVQAIAW